MSLHLLLSDWQKLETGEREKGHIYTVRLFSMYPSNSLLISPMSAFSWCRLMELSHGRGGVREQR